MDYNDTLLDKGAKDIWELWTDEKYFTKRAKMYKAFIIVHLRFMKPEINWIDTKYTVMDKFANFGGKSLFISVVLTSYYVICKPITVTLTSRSSRFLPLFVRFWCCQ